MRRFRTVVLIVSLFAAGVAAQALLGRMNPSRVPARRESVAAMLGGFRSVAAEAVWFRIDWLQERGRFSEIAQLSTILSFLEPHVPEVWVYSAWNLAYNISVRMAGHEDRWVWVREAVALLRDKGLRWNPSSSEIYRELASLFMLKIGSNLDESSPHYRRMWRSIVADVSSRGAWSEIGMDVKTMDEIESAFGGLDWGDPFASSLYWAWKGREACGLEYRAYFTESVRQSKILYDRNKDGKQ